MSTAALPRAAALRLATAYLARAGQFRRWLPLLFVLVLVNAGMQATTPRISGWLLDRVLADANGFVHDILPWAALIVVVATVFYAIIEYWQKFFITRISCHVKAQFQTGLYRHLLHLDDAFYLKHRSGDITSRITKDVQEGIDPAVWSFCQIWWATAMVVLAIVILMQLDWRLGTLFTVLLPPWALYLRWLGRCTQQLDRAVKDEFGKLNARATEDIANQSLIRLSGKEAERAAAFRAAGDAYLAKALRLSHTTNLALAAQSAVLTFVVPLVVLGLCAGPLRLGLTPGELLAAYGTWVAASMPVDMLGRYIPHFISGLTSMGRVFDFLDERPLVTQAADATDLVVRGGQVRLSGVRFAYPGTDTTVLDGIDLELPAGTSTAIVGPSGSGKSTLAHLVMRFHDPQAGCITIDGQDLRGVRLRSLRRQVGLVQQDTQLWSGSVRDNLRFVAPEADDDRLWAALADAELASFIRQTTQGLDTLLGERGVRLSGGQRQRLALARLFLQAPPLVILDEATSALDGVVEQAIQAAMRRLMAGRTALVVAHRLSTIVDCDRIVWLERGRIVAAGPHTQLLATCPAYASAWASQAGT